MMPIASGLRDPGRPRIVRPTSISAATLALLVAISWTQEGRAEPPAAPSKYLESIEERGSVGGVETEADAEAAQAERAASGGPTPGLDRRATQQVEEIVVQARRRDELLEDTPVSVTALDQSSLREIGATRLDDIQQLVPNLEFAQNLDGQSAGVFIRGVGQSDSALAFDPGVGLYIDGVYLARSFGSLIDLVDIQQVEVLRGPQGTLFGKNTVGGAINITSVKPHEELEAFAMVRAGNRDTVETRATLNLPLVDDLLYSRFAIASNNTRGHMYNTFLDEYWSNTQSLSFLGTLRFLPLDDVTFDITGTWSRNRSRGLGARCIAVQESADPALAGLLASFYPGYLEECGEDTPYRFQANTRGISDVESYGVWGTGVWSLGELGPLEDFALKSITSWRQQVTRLRQDPDYQSFPIIIRNLIGGDDPLGLDGEPNQAQQIGQEFQAIGSGFDGRLNFVTGLYMFWETASEGDAIQALRFQADGSPGVPNGTFVAPIDKDDWSWALFAQATWDVVEWASLTGGLRYTEEKKGLSKFQSNPLTPEAPPSVDADSSAIYTAWTPMASLALTLPDDRLPDRLDHLMGYFTYARGFKGGGFNAIAGNQVPAGQTATTLEPFAPEFLDSWEVGFKTIALDQSLTFNASFFLSQYDDIQVVAGDLIPGPNPEDLPQVLRIVQNAAKATIKGAEFEVQSRPFEGLVLTGSAGLLDARFDDYPGAQNALTSQDMNRAGESLNNSPALQTHVSIQYSFPLDAPGPAWLDGWLTPRLDWYYQSSVHYAGPEIVDLTQGGYNQLGARLSFDFMDDRAQVALWGMNLTDKTYYAGGFTTATFKGTVHQLTAPPISFGGELSYRF